MWHFGKVYILLWESSLARMKYVIMSIGRGKTIVEFFSAEMVFSVCKNSRVLRKYAITGVATHLRKTKVASLPGILTFFSCFWTVFKNSVITDILKVEFQELLRKLDLNTPTIPVLLHAPQIETTILCVRDFVRYHK